MNCSEARSAIGPDLTPTPTSAEAEEGFEHYRNCEACQRFYAHQVRLTDRLKRFNTPRAPDALRGRILAALDDEVRQQASQPKPTRRRWIVAGLAAAAIAGAVWLSRLEPPNAAQQAAAMMARSFRDSAMDDRMTSEEAASLRDWLTERIGASVDIPEIPEAHLMGGRIAKLEGVATAAIRYEYHGMELVYFMIPASTLSRRMPEDDNLWPFAANGYELVLWRDGLTTRAVMAPMPRAELESIAEQCRRKALL